MIVAIQQPEHIPWLGFFNKMLKADEFIYLDNVQFKKRYFENRNKIRTKKGWEWLTVPVITKGLYTQRINEVAIDYAQGWQQKYLNKVKTNYVRAPFFDEFFPKLEGIINANAKKIVALNLSLIEMVRQYLGIDTSVALASAICDGKGSDLILALCLNRRADTYLSGPDGKNYLKLDDFKKNNINVEYHDYRHPEYKQMHKPFLSRMSILDLLFNYGRGSIEAIRK